MWSERRQKTNEYAQIFPGYIRRLLKSIRKDHKLADCCVEFHFFYILGYFLDGFVKKNGDLAGRAFFLRYLGAAGFFIFFGRRESRGQSPNFLQKTPDADKSVLVPDDRLFKRPHKHFVDPQSISPESFYNIVGIYDIAFRF